MKKKDPTSHRIIEKRRRDRMNNCLSDLSKLIPSQYMRKGRGRVEKTEIIEMAIRHLKDLRESSAGPQRSAHEPAGGPCQEDLSCGQQKVATAAVKLSIDGTHTVNLQSMTSSALPLDCTSQGMQQLAAISASDTYMTDSNGIPHGAAVYNQSLGHQKVSVVANPASASLSMKAFQHQQYHNNERQINNRVSEQNSKYRNECCTCRGRAAARNNDGSSGNNGNDNNNNSSSSDQSDTGSIDYPSSSSGSNKTETINKSTSESSSGEGSPTSSSSSSSSSGWYKKAWLIRSFSRSVSKN